MLTKSIRSRFVSTLLTVAVMRWKRDLKKLNSDFWFGSDYGLISFIKNDLFTSLQDPVLIWYLDLR
jgi:hypothetical protein